MKEKLKTVEEFWGFQPQGPPPASPSPPPRNRREKRRQSGKWDNQTTMRITFELREKLLTLVTELAVAVEKGRAKPFWDHKGDPYTHEVVSWLLRQYRDLQRRRKKSQGTRKQKKAALKAAGLED